jgi:hypothetical protein
MVRKMGQKGSKRRRVIVSTLCAALCSSVLGASAVRASTVQASTVQASRVQASAVQDSGPSTYTTTISVNPSGKVTGAISDQLIGLSVESSTLNNGYRYDDVGNLAQLLRNLGSSVFRFGGNTADTSYTDDTPRILAGIDRLAKASGWSVIWTENLAEFNAARVTADARALTATLGSKLFAIACGNEPDMFVYGGTRPESYTADDYLAQEAACFQAIRQGAAHAPLAGPDTAWNPAWLAAFAAREAGQVAALDQHYYPLGCAQPGDNPTTLAAYLLSPALARTEAAHFNVFAAAARTARAPLMITETNSACDGGVHGLSNAYASALWAVDYLLTGAEHGVHGMNFHGGLNTLCAGYTVLCQVGISTYSPQPIYYGMLFTHLFRTGAFLPVKVSMSARAGNIAAFADKPSQPGSIRVMVENLSEYQARATLRLGAYRGAVSVLHLTGPSLLATSGVEIQGATVAANGSLTPGKPDVVQCGSDGCAIPIAPYSAVLVTLG